MRIPDLSQNTCFTRLPIVPVSHFDFVLGLDKILFFVSSMNSAFVSIIQNKFPFYALTGTTEA